MRFPTTTTCPHQFPLVIFHGEEIVWVLIVTAGQDRGSGQLSGKKRFPHLFQLIDKITHNYFTTKANLSLDCEVKEQKVLGSFWEVSGTSGAETADQVLKGLGN